MLSWPVGRLFIPPIRRKFHVETLFKNNKKSMLGELIWGLEWEWPFAALRGKMGKEDDVVDERREIQRIILVLGCFNQIWRQENWWRFPNKTGWCIAVLIWMNYILSFILNFDSLHLWVMKCSLLHQCPGSSSPTRCSPFSFIYYLCFLWWKSSRKQMWLSLFDGWWLAI